MADSQPEQSSSALPVVGERFYELDSQPVKPERTPSPRFSADGETMEPYQPPPDISALGGKANELPHVVFKSRVAVIGALKLEGYTRKQIADAMGMSVSGVHWCIKEARRRGLLRKGLEDALNMLDEEAVPLAAEGLVALLKKRDKDAIFTTLQGKGLLRTYTQNKNEGPVGGPNMAFQFNFVTPPGTAPAPLPPVPLELSNQGTKQVFGVERDE